MREILFKGKRIDNGEWVYGWYVRTERHHCIITGCIDDGYVVYGHYANNVTMYVVDSATIGQYTGLTDNNGQKIFEWDIVKWFGKKYTVVYKEGRFIGEEEQFISVDEYKFINLYGSLEVVGNVHEVVR